MAVDDDEDTIEAAMARKAKSIDKRNSNKEKRAKKTAGVESSPEPSRDSSVAPSSRKRKSAGNKRKADDEVDEEPPPKKNRTGARAPRETLSTRERNLLQKILNSNAEALMDFEEEVPGEQPSDDEEEGPVTRGLIDPFLKPVPKAQFPDYYVLIQRPICMDQIKKKIKKEEYQSLREYREDIRLLCNNARTYNEDGSMLYQDADKIEVCQTISHRK